MYSNDEVSGGKEKVPRTEGSNFKLFSEKIIFILKEALRREGCDGAIFTGPSQYDAENKSRQHFIIFFY